MSDVGAAVAAAIDAAPQPRPSSSVIDLLAARARERIELHIPEWGGTFYASQMTIEDERRAVVSLHGASGGRGLRMQPGDDPEFFARLVFDKLEHEDGSRVFPADSYQRFKATAPSKICKFIGLSIWNGSVTPIEEAEGN